MNMAAPSLNLPASFRPKQRLGFNTRVSFNDDDGPAEGLRQGIELFKQAERLGYQSGWAYQRHFDHYLSSPLPFFAAAGHIRATSGLARRSFPCATKTQSFCRGGRHHDLLIGGAWNLPLRREQTGIRRDFRCRRDGRQNRGKAPSVPLPRRHLRGCSAHGHGQGQRCCSRC